MLAAIILQMKPPVQNQLFDRTDKQMSLARYECVCLLNNCIMGYILQVRGPHRSAEFWWV